MSGSVNRRVSLESNLSTDSFADSPSPLSDDRSPPQNLESQFLRQPSHVPYHTPMASVRGGIAARDVASVSSFASQASQFSQASALTSGSEKPVRKKRTTAGVVYTPATLNYHNINIYQAANQGNLPVVVLLWSMAANKKINLMSHDFQGNNPMHYACLADSSEVCILCSFCWLGLPFLFILDLVTTLSLSLLLQFSFAPFLLTLPSISNRLSAF